MTLVSVLSERLRSLQRTMTKLLVDFRMLFVSKEEKQEVLDFLMSVPTVEEARILDFIWYSELFAAKGLFADCPQDETERRAFFEQGSYFLPPDEEEEADRRARSPLGDAEWMPTVVEPLAGTNLEKATDVQMLRMLYLRMQYTVNE